MAFRFFKPENQAQGAANSNVPLGNSNADDGTVLERYVTLGWVSNPQVSWLDYMIGIETYLDSGIVLHKVLPQSSMTVDTLASVLADPLAAVVNNTTGINLPDFTTQAIDQYVRGVNTQGNGQYKDYFQRMATSDYTFVLKGWGLRAGYQVPVPGMKSVAGIPCIPTRQWARGNYLVGNFSGVPLFFNQWELWYSVSVPPKQDQLPPPNVGQHIRADAKLPTGLQVPWSQPDENAAANLPTPNFQKPAAQAGTTNYNVGITNK